MKLTRLFTVSVVTLSLGTIMSGLTSPATAAPGPKAGASCKKVNAKSGSGSKVLVCTKTAKGLKWTAVKPSKPTDSKPADSKPADTKPGDTKPAQTKPPTAPTTAPTTTKASDTTLPSRSATKRTGALKTAGKYAASGTIELSGTSAAGTLTLVDAKVDPGPELVIYLTPKAGAVTISGAVKIAAFKSTPGTQSFVVPAGTDLAAFSGVLIWCDKFSVPFAIAELK